MEVKPITPSEARKNGVKANIPEWVLKGVNNAILEAYVPKDWFTMSQDFIMTKVLLEAPEGMTRDKIFKNKWFDFEAVYRSAGWQVKYDKPGYNESYEAFFEFKEGNK
jgi:hypothetical protein